MNEAKPKVCIDLKALTVAELAELYRAVAAEIKRRHDERSGANYGE